MILFIIYGIIYESNLRLSISLNAKQNQKMKNKFQEKYKKEYESKYVAVSIDSGDIFDCDQNFSRLYRELPKSVRIRTFFFYVKDEEFTFIRTYE